MTKIQHTVTLDSGRDIDLTLCLGAAEPDVGIPGRYIDDWYPAQSITKAEAKEIEGLLECLDLTALSEPDPDFLRDLRADPL